MSFPQSMDNFLAQLRAAAEPTRLRLLALVPAAPSACPTSPRSWASPSRGCPATSSCCARPGCWSACREGANVWFALPPGDAGLVARAARPPAGGRPGAGRRPPPGRPACWPNAPASPPRASAGRAPTGTRCGRSACPPRRSRRRCCRCCRRGAGPGAGYRHRHRPAAGIAGPAGRGGARRRCQPGHAGAGPRPAGRARPRRHCAVRQADMYRLPLPDAGFDVVVLQMVLHYAEDPAAALAEAARVLRPGGRLLVVDLAAHEPRRSADQHGASLAGLRRCRAWPAGSVPPAAPGCRR